MHQPRCVVLDGWTLTQCTLAEPGRGGEPRWEHLARIVELTVYPRTARSELLERARDAELVLTNKVVLDRELLESLPALRYVGVLATGTNVVDLLAAKQRGIVVTNAPGYASESVVAHVFGLILELELQIGAHASAVRNGTWSKAADFSFRLDTTRELSGLTLGIVGFGNIGRRVAEVGAAFGMQVVAATRTPMHPALEHVRFVPLDELFSVSDVVSLHCPLTPETHQFVDARRLSLMKPEAILVNTGRGPLIDETALAEALTANRIRGAGLDVLSVEPPPADHPLLRAPRCVVTPHNAWATTAARQRLMQIVTSNVAAYLAGHATNRVA